MARCQMEFEMTDKIQKARRAEFEAWFECLNHRKPEIQYSIGGHYYADQRTEDAWLAFNAALDCVVIELPPELHAYTGRPQDDRLLYADRNHTIKQCRAAIESTNLGIKVK